METETEKVYKALFTSIKSTEISPVNFHRFIKELIRSDGQLAIKDQNFHKWNASGTDGHLEIEGSGNEWVPSMKSTWEITTSLDINRRKFIKDFEKNIDSSDDFKKTTFVFVCCAEIDNDTREKWKKEARSLCGCAEKEIRILDIYNLVDWLLSTPARSVKRRWLDIWDDKVLKFSEFTNFILGKIPDFDSKWLLNFRENESDKLSNYLKNKSKDGFSVFCKSYEEGALFISSVLDSIDGNKKAFLSDNLDDIKNDLHLNTYGDVLFVIKNYSDDGFLSKLINDGHHVLFLQKSNKGYDDDNSIVLNSVGVERMKRILKETNFEPFANGACGCWSALLVSLTSKICPDLSNLLIAAFLIGGGETSAKYHDNNFIEEVTDVNPKEFARELRKFHKKHPAFLDIYNKENIKKYPLEQLQQMISDYNENDKITDTLSLWRVKNKEKMLADLFKKGLVSGELIGLFYESAVDVILNENNSYSDILIENVVNSLVLISKNNFLGANTFGRTAKAINSIMKNASKSKWSIRRCDAHTLIEINPEHTRELLFSDINSNNDFVKLNIDDVKQAINTLISIDINFGTRTFHFLFDFVMNSKSDDYFRETAIHTLASIYRGIHPYSHNVELIDKKDKIDIYANTNSDVVWEILSNCFVEGAMYWDVSFDRERYSYGKNIKLNNYDVNNIRKTRRHVWDSMMCVIGNDQNRLLSFFDTCLMSRLLREWKDEDIDNAIKSISENHEKNVSAEKIDTIKKHIRHVLHVDYGYSSEMKNKLKKLLNQLADTNPVKEFLWVFSYSSDISDENLDSIRAEKFKLIFDGESIDNLNLLLKGADDGFMVGLAMKDAYPDINNETVIGYLDKLLKSGCEFGLAVSFFRGYILNHNSKNIESEYSDMLNCVNESPNIEYKDEIILSILLCMKYSSKLNETLKKYNDEILSKYWEYVICEHDQESMKEFVENCCKYGPIEKIMHFTFAFDITDIKDGKFLSDFVFSILEVFNTHKQNSSLNRGSHDRIWKMIKLLQASKDISDECKVELEQKYLSIFYDSFCVPEYIFKKMSVDPDFFVSEMQKIDRFRIFGISKPKMVLPGVVDDESIDKTRMKKWIDDAIIATVKIDNESIKNHIYREIAHILIQCFNLDSEIIVPENLIDFFENDISRIVLNFIPHALHNHYTHTNDGFMWIGDFPDKEFYEVSQKISEYSDKLKETGYPKLSELFEEAGKSIKEHKIEWDDS